MYPNFVPRNVMEDTTRVTRFTYSRELKSTVVIKLWQNPNGMHDAFNSPALLSLRDIFYFYYLQHARRDFLMYQEYKNLNARSRDMYRKYQILVKRLIKHRVFTDLILNPIIYYIFCSVYLQSASCRKVTFLFPVRRTARQ